MAPSLDSCEDDEVRSGGKRGRIHYIENKIKIDVHLERYREIHDDGKKEASQAFLKSWTEDRQITSATRREENPREGTTKATKAARQNCL